MKTKITKDFLLKMNGIRKEPSKKTMTCKQFYNAAVKDGNCTDINHLFKSIHTALTGKSGQVQPLPKKASGFKIARNGHLPEIRYEAMSHGVWCQHEGHLGSHHTVDSIDEICPKCYITGPPMENGVVKYWPVPPLMPIKSMANCFFIVLVSRSSHGASIPSTLFQTLRQCIIDNFREIRRYLKEKTGIVYELHVVGEAGANGSIMSLPSDMIRHTERDADTHKLHLPMAYVTDLFQYYYMPNSKVGYMMNYPGDFSGKMANFAHTLKELELFGIPPSDVMYMSYGVEIIRATTENKCGVDPNFTMCSGEELLQTIEICNSTGVPDCKEPTVNGFLSAACNHTTERFVRPPGKRRNQAVPKTST